MSGYGQGYGQQQGQGYVAQQQQQQPQQVVAAGGCAVELGGLRALVPDSFSAALLSNTSDRTLLLLGRHRRIGRPRTPAAQVPQSPFANRLCVFVSRASSMATPEPSR